MSASCTSVGAWCYAQRIKISMIAGGNHTIISYQSPAAPVAIYNPSALRAPPFTHGRLPAPTGLPSPMGKVARLKP